MSMSNEGIDPVSGIADMRSAVIRAHRLASCVIGALNVERSRGVRKFLGDVIFEEISDTHFLPVVVASGPAGEKRHAVQLRESLYATQQIGVVPGLQHVFPFPRGNTLERRVSVGVYDLASPDAGYGRPVDAIDLLPIRLDPDAAPVVLVEGVWTPPDRIQTAEAWLGCLAQSLQVDIRDI